MTPIISQYVVRCDGLLTFGQFKTFQRAEITPHPFYTTIFAKGAEITILSHPANRLHSDKGEKRKYGVSRIYDDFPTPLSPFKIEECRLARFMTCANMLVNLSNTRYMGQNTYGISKAVVIFLAAVLASNARSDTHNQRIAVKRGGLCSSLVEATIQRGRRR